LERGQGSTESTVNPKRDHPVQYRVTAGLLNIRNGASTRDAVLGQLRKNQVIDALEESPDGRWVKTAFQDREGWVSKKHLKILPYLPGSDEDFAWMSVAEKEIGIIEIPGRLSHPRVLEYLSATDVRSIARTSDETDWCSAFVNWCLSKAGYEGTGSALARSWLDWGQKIDTPRKGCIVIFSRGRRFGHVGFYIGETDTEIIVLGGNQNNPETNISGVNLKYYPKSRLLGYRIPG